MLTGTDAQIKNAYEVEGKDPDFIAEDLGFDVTAVKAKLMQISAQYRKACGAPDSEISDRTNFNEEDSYLFKEVIKECALNAQLPDGTPDYRTRLKAATYGRDDIKGRHDVRAVKNGPQFNILMLNESIAAARINAQKAKESLPSSTPQRKAIEV